MKTPLYQSKGFSLVEILTGVVLTMGLFALAAPSFKNTMMNGAIRSAAESGLSVVQQARSEAVKTQKSIYFSLVSSNDNTCQPSDAGLFFVVSREIPNNNCGVGPSETSSPKIIFQGKLANPPTTLSGVGGKTVRFGSFGTVIPNADSSSPLSEIKLSSSKRSNSITEYNVQISSAGRIKMCNPGITSGDPRSCD